MGLKKEAKEFTYADYKGWPENERWEIIDGEAFMQAAPSWQHQKLSVELARQISNYLINKPCMVFSAPFDLCLSEYNEDDDNIRNIFQPDIVVVCDESKLRKTGYFGVPSLIIEILSPSTARADKLTKFNKYEKAGVKEYWIVDSENKVIDVFILQENNRYERSDVYTFKDKVKVSIFNEFEMDLSMVVK